MPCAPARHAVLQVGARQPADARRPGSRACAQSRAKRSQPRLAGLVLDRAEHREVELERHRVLELLARVAGGAASRAFGRARSAISSAGGEVHAVGAGLRRLDQHLARRSGAPAPMTCSANERSLAPVAARAPAPAAVRPRGARSSAPASRAIAEPRRVGDRVFERQRERGEHRRVGRQHRRDHRRVQALPGDRLALARMRLAAPVETTRKKCSRTVACG